MSITNERPNSSYPFPKLISRDLLLLFISSFLFYSSMYLILNYLPGYVLELGGTEVDIGLVTAALVFSSLLVRPFVGWIIDHIGRKQVLIAGNIFFILAPLLYFFPNSAQGLLPARILLGIGFSLFTTSALTIVIDISDSKHRGESTGLFLSAQLLAISLAPAIGGFIAGEKNLLTLIPSVIGIAVLSFFCSLFVKPPKEPGKIAQTTRWSFGGISLLFSPLLATISIGIGYAVVITFLPLLVMENGLSQASYFYLIYALSALIFRTAAGRISDQVGREQLIIPSLALNSLALFLLSASNSLVGIVISALIYGIGFGAAYPVLGAMVADLSPVNARGIVFGFYSGSFDLGLLIGTIFGGIVGLFFGTSSIFLLAAIFIAIGLITFSYLTITLSSKQIQFPPK